MGTSAIWHPTCFLRKRAVTSPNFNAVIRAAVLWMMVATAALAQSPEPGGNRVVSVTGVLTVRRAQQDARVLRVNDSVEIGDELTTGENSEAIIRTADGATVRIFPDSRVLFSQRPAGLQEFLHLLLGSIKVHIEKISGRPNPHKMTTPTAIIAVRGTTFSVFVDETDATLVAVDEGIVSVANVQSPSQEVFVHRSQRTLVRPGQLPMQARRYRGASEHADMMPAGSMGTGAMTGSGMNAGMHGSTGHMTGSASHGSHGWKH